MSKEAIDKQAKQEKEEKRARKEAKREKKRLAEEAATEVAEPVQFVKEADPKVSKESKKSKKRKLDDEVVEEPKEKKRSKKVKADDEAMEDVIVAPAKPVEDIKKSKKSKKAKKEDKIIVDAVEAHTGTVEEPKKSKKSKKRKSEGDTEKPTKVTNGTSAADNEVPVAELKALKKKAKRDGKATKGVSDSVPGEPTADEEEQDAEVPVKKNQRFIVFIGEFTLFTSCLQYSIKFVESSGNLPYTATEESIKQHFIKIRPTSIRPRKGYAFMDFDHYDRMKTCLSLYHHSSFDDGISPAREINVELT